jgi:hypothetical protein
MPAFRRVEDRKAGPAALGVLAPPGRRTFLILRPRSLPWDLLLVRDDDAFRDLSREEAAAAAQGLILALDAWAAGGPGDIEIVSTADGARVRVRAGSFGLVVCPREAGRPYRPLAFPDARSAEDAGSELAAVLRPVPGAGQELYFNTRHFDA